MIKLSIADSQLRRTTVQNCLNDVFMIVICMVITWWVTCELHELMAKLRTKILTNWTGVSYFNPTCTCFFGCETTVKLIFLITHTVFTSYWCHLSNIYLSTFSHYVNKSIFYCKSLNFIVDFKKIY